MAPRHLRAIPGLVAAFVIASPVRAAAATVSVNVADGPGEGLNDATPAAPVGGNTGTTLGQQRLRVLEHAASVWGATLESGVTVQITARFDPLTCTATSGTLGSTSPSAAWQNFTGAPLPQTWYVSALANSRAGSDLDPTQDDISMVFNSGVGTTGCLEGGAFYLGLDGNHGSATDLYAVVLHEMAHGLGFVTLVNRDTGQQAGGYPDAFETRMLDVGTGRPWTSMTDAERAASAKHARFVAWNGPVAKALVPQVLSLGYPVLTLTGGVGELPVGLAQFGPAVGQPAIVAPVVAAQDTGGASTTDACETVVGSVAGKVALIDRGTCTFTTKVAHAQAAGAVAVLILDNVAGSPPAGLGGTDPSITIPSVRITQSDGVTLRAALAAGPVSATLGTDPTRYIGADAAGRALVYTPSPTIAGSSLSHFDLLATPDLLMEPEISANQTHALDLTPGVLADLGWTLATSGAAAVPALPASASSLAGIALLLLGLRALGGDGRSRATRSTDP